MLVEKLELWEGLFPLKKQNSRLFKHLLVAFWQAIAHYIHVATIICQAEKQLIPS
ncbi:MULTISPECIES: hypothetical protein [Nostoc]|uniref:Transposase n=1 Tax=Nostoc paludosum FACHB-159 TaxID=2692908 RepID=A0ABR8KFL0_9NOSO|nr:MULTISPECIES: hypothetical protein [Nostoc]MBD2681184.1 hypothetical protein [Nostoc sp. FACHB-857]MBD2737639.1 hypothetical protein [Nostoc paludosum FACHB-159]